MEFNVEAIAPCKKKVAVSIPAERIREEMDKKYDEINDAVAKNPAYIQLQSLEALKEMSKDPASKLYFMDSNSSSPLPLLHIGDGQKN